VELKLYFVFFLYLAGDSFIKRIGLAINLGQWIGLGMGIGNRIGSQRVGQVCCLFVGVGQRLAPQVAMQIAAGYLSTLPGSTLRLHSKIITGQPR